MDKVKPGFWTAANIFTLLRFALIPPFVLALAGRRAVLALVLFSAAGLTDFLDGLAARALHQQSPLGVILDPAADKLLMTVSFIALSLRSAGGPTIIPLWLTGPVIVRDVAIALGVLIIVKTVGSKPFRPSIWGKASTIIQIGCVGLVLLFNALGTAPRWLLGIYILTLAATLISGGDYFLGRFRPWMNRKQAG